MQDNSITAAIDTSVPESNQAALNDLNTEIMELFVTQAFQPEKIQTPADVCSAFSNILGRHWRLCSIAIYLRSDGGQVRQSACYVGKRFDKEKIAQISSAVAMAVESNRTETIFWASQNGSSSGGVDDLLRDAGVEGCVGEPIHSGNELAGVLIVVSANRERLLAALGAIRLIAAPIVIAVENLKRANGLAEQNTRIEGLVEDLQKHSQALEDANGELRRVAQYRSMFLARMTHELRTPLTSILGFAEILLDHEILSETQARFCGKIQASGLQLQARLNHLVDLSRLEAGQSELFLHEFSVREALKESCSAVTRQAEKLNVSLEWKIEDIPPVISDEGKLRQVLFNFILYAIRRSPQGANVSVLAGPASASRFFIEIRDWGESVYDTEGLFEAVDGNSAVEKSTNLNELGLVIARRLIDVLSGSIVLKSLDPIGLVVRLEFPTALTV